MSSVLDRLFHRLIVSVQADPGEPFYKPECLLAMAQAVVNGGAAGLRLANPENIALIKEYLPHIPVIGITKPPHLPTDPGNHVYITPTLLAAESVARADAEIVAMDATQRPRPNGENLSDIVAKMKVRFPQTALMADIATLEEAQHAQTLGFDCVGTTLAGYTAETRNSHPLDEPDFALLKTLVNALACPVILEGRVWTPAHVRQAMDMGAYAIVIGSAITRPHLITQRFVQAFPHLSAVHPGQ